eukprot:6213309-Pleurochrysis_carterae.AAC.2
MNINGIVTSGPEGAIIIVSVRLNNDFIPARPRPRMGVPTTGPTYSEYVIGITDRIGVIGIIYRRYAHLI